MIHGTGDDNVHISHTMALSRELVENDVIFRQQVRTMVVHFCMSAYGENVQTPKL